MNHEEQSENYDYSEWKGGAALIAKKWQRDRADSVHIFKRPYNWHKHYRGQLLCVDEGLIQVSTEAGVWVLPPHRAGWIPPQAMHRVYFCGKVKGWSLLLSPDRCHQLPDSPCVIAMNDVLNVLSARAFNWSKTHELTADKSRIQTVIIDEISKAPHEALHFPQPKDPRLQKITHAILADPSNTKKVEYWASIGAISSRTLRRLIRTELNMSFHEWRQQIQLVYALEMMARGKPVGDVAFALGYATPSNFIAMFRRVYGKSPGRYFASQ